MPKLVQLFVVLILGLSLSACQSAAPEEKPLYYSYEKFEDIAPLFEKNTDTTYVINFWATWCKPCVEELPYFEQLHDNLQGKKAKVILVSLDFKKDIESKFIPFLEERQLGSEVALLLDGKYNDWIDKVDPSWSGAIPVTLVYEGESRTFHGEQFSSYEELESIVNKYL